MEETAEPSLPNSYSYDQEEERGTGHG